MTEKNAIFYILGLGFVIRLVLTMTAGSHMYLYSDDVYYLYSGLDFLKSGYFTYMDNNYPTVFAMPGFLMFLAGVFSVFGTGETGLFVVRFLLDCMGTLTILGVYLCAEMITKRKNVANCAALFCAVCIPFIAINNILLTETPGLCALIFLTYFLLKFGEDRKDKTFAMLLGVYLACVLIKPVYGIFPVAFLPAFLYNKFSWKEFMKCGVLAALALVLCLSPWIIRNYIVTGDVIPLTGNQGDTLLLGSFDGENVPAGTFDESVAIADARALEKGYTHPYFAFKERGNIGRERIEQWKETDPVSYYKSTILKPLRLMNVIYYPITVFDIEAGFLYPFFRVQLFLGALAVLFLLLRWKQNARSAVYTASYVIGTMLVLYINARYAAIPRYGFANLLMVHVFSAAGTILIYDILRGLFCRFGVKKK